MHVVVALRLCCSTRSGTSNMRAIPVIRASCGSFFLATSPHTHLAVCQGPKPLWKRGRMRPMPALPSHPPKVLSLPLSPSLPSPVYVSPSISLTLIDLLMWNGPGSGTLSSPPTPVAGPIKKHVSKCCEGLHNSHGQLPSVRQVETLRVEARLSALEG